MIGGGRPDLVAAFVPSAALIAWILGPGWWTPVIGATLVGFGPGYLVLRGVAHTVPDVLVRVVLYIVSSLAISALVGLILSALGIPLNYMSLASAYLVVTATLFAVRELAVRLGKQDDRHRPHRPELDRGARILERAALIKGSLLVIAPVIVSWALLASAPVRTPPSTELYFAPTGGHIGDLPTIYRPAAQIELRLIAHLGVPATNEILEISANGRMVDSWEVPPGSASIDRVVSVDTSLLESKSLRIEALLSSPGENQSVVWLNLVEAPPR